VALAFAEGFGQATAGPLQWLGDALGLGRGAAVGATTARGAGSRLSSLAPEKTLAWQLGVSAVLLAGAGCCWASAGPQRLDALAAGAFAFQVVVISFATFLVRFWLVRHYPATPVASFTLLTPDRRAGLRRAPAGRAAHGCGCSLAAASVAAGIWLVNRR
jgi:drug/metabolite transporter (DMT)-like permease